MNRPQLVKPTGQKKLVLPYTHREAGIYHQMAERFVAAHKQVNGKVAENSYLDTLTGIRTIHVAANSAPDTPTL